MYKIGELSKLSKIPVKTLRYYDSEGILTPDYIDDFTGYRYYDAAKLSDCYRIIALKELGFSLNEIKDAFLLPKDRFSELLLSKEQELNQLKKQTEYRIGILRNLNTALKENEAMFDIVIRKSDEIRLLYERRIVKDRAEGERVLEELRNAVPRDLLGDRRVLIDYETGFVSEDFDCGFGVEIKGSLVKPCAFAEKMLHFTDDTASLICSEEDYDEAVRALHKYVLDNNYQIV